MKWAIYIIMAVLAAAMANATYISITTTVKAAVQDNTLAVLTNISNSGDESA